MGTPVATPGIKPTGVLPWSRLSECERLVEVARLLACQVADRAQAQSCSGRAANELDRTASDLARAQARLHHLLRRSRHP
jgi:hypothetical protein